MKTVKNLFGMRTNAQKAAERETTDSQRRQMAASQEEAGRLRAEASASGRRLRGAGRAALAFQGNQAGLASTLAG